MGSLEKRLDALEKLIPPAPPEVSTLPVEEWLDECMAGSGPALYGEDELFFRWLEDLPWTLHDQIGVRLAAAQGRPHSVLDEIPPLPREVVERIWAALPPHIECKRVAFAEAAPEREAKRRMAEEEERRRGGRYAGKGREWLRAWDQEREELRRKYGSFEEWSEAWAQAYAEWQRARGL
jgi:hypothetical protein